ncbi:hypothetical protein FA95DRAFT_1603247 [Auriscalpium vulgare]|uniref:Uncharacterized protein n=1 Tax=Auriscalpium vulgare TaxID=40419 RepID=A0ACB8S3Q3_9AGAM|nr:hypothetical protein FA95DRAFT_1603247 [Auriscalpium vulgare]
MDSILARFADLSPAEVVALFASHTVDHGLVHRVLLTGKRQPAGTHGLVLQGHTATIQAGLTQNDIEQAVSIQGFVSSFIYL